MPKRPAPRPSTRLLLRIGFGGLLILMAFTGADALQVLQSTQNRNETIRQDFLTRSRLLNQIRSDLYLSGTYVRDYLLEPAPQNAERHRASLERTRREMGIALAAYSARLTVSERQPFGALRSALTQYWRILNPVLRWEAVQRRAGGYTFLRDEVFPRRMAMLNIADQIALVNEQQLTAGNQQVASLFSQFRLRLGLTLLITLGLGLLLAAFSMRKILALEQESSSRFVAGEQARTELKELSARLVQAQESERRAISRELHDEVGQSLSALLLGLSNLSAAIPPAARQALQEHVDQLRTLAETTIVDVRNITLLLRPSMLDDLGLVPALQWQAREVSKRTGLLISLAAESISDELPDDYKTCIYRLTQEALHNCARHAHAQQVRISVRQEAAGVFLSIQDDGRGFRPEFERGVGLLGMQERVTHLGGKFQVVSEPGQGTVITTQLPSPAAAAQETNQPA